MQVTIVINPQYAYSPFKKTVLSGILSNWFNYWIRQILDPAEILLPMITLLKLDHQVSSQNKCIFSFNTWLSWFWGFCDIFWTINGRVSKYCELFLTVLRHVLAINQSYKWIVWLFKYCLKKGFWSEILKNHIKKTFLGSILSVLWLFMKSYKIWWPCHKQLKIGHLIVLILKMKIKEFGAENFGMVDIEINAWSVLFAHLKINLVFKLISRDLRCAL